ncbi:MAG: response regulator transcription factor [Brooklawnia sp.]|uniref:LuxR C-terminal-related transcriptional regulator n=1 Tax=Brooklawnia sp. TaxID=2699740 RepID=UPI003C788F75
MRTDTRPITVAVVNDYELVVAGVNEILKPYADRIKVIELDVNTAVSQPVDIVLFDTFGCYDGMAGVAESVARRWLPGRIVLYTWELNPAAEAVARAAKVDGAVSKGLGGAELVEALEAVHSGEGFVFRDNEPGDADDEQANGNLRHSHDWPGRAAGLSMREAEMISLICQGLSNAQIAQHAYLSPNSVKSYIRSAYRKMGVSTRAQAVAWGIQAGLLPEVGRTAV